MTIHNWARVHASMFHDFHTSWIVYLKDALNQILPEGYFANAEQHIGRKIADVLAIHISDPFVESTLPEPSLQGSVAVLESPPQVSRTMIASPEAKGSRRTLTIRHVSGNRIIALIEILSRGNKSSKRSLEEFVDKCIAALHSGIHLVTIDLFPPGPIDPNGIHGAIWDQLAIEEYVLAPDKPLSFVSYSSGTPITAYVENRAIGDDMPEMPLFLHPDRYLKLPLAKTYESVVMAMPRYSRDMLEGKSS